MDSNKKEFFDKDGKVLSVSDVMSMLPPMIVVEKVNRVEVIDQNGRSYTNWHISNIVELSFQDAGRTLKVFISR